tara:strand:+ start:34 stop:531 length:498 start_codon:yes stop_codon:yes gene_type:complete
MDIHNPQIPLQTPQLIINHWFANGLTHLTQVRNNFDLSTTYASSLLSESDWVGILKDRGIDVNELLSSENKAVLEKLQTFDQLMRDKTNAIETFIKEQFLTYDDLNDELKNRNKDNWDEYAQDCLKEYSFLLDRIYECYIGMQNTLDEIADLLHQSKKNAYNGEC